MLNNKRAKAFRDETYELLEELETALLELEKTPDSEDIIGRIFRAMHTIKGSGAMFGFDAISVFTHEAETVFDFVRNGRLTVSKELIDLTLAVRDQIKTMVGEFDGGAEADKSRTEELTLMLKKFVPIDDEQDAVKDVFPFVEKDCELTIDGIDKVESALAEQQHMNEIQKKRQNIDNSPSVRVASNKLDALVDLVGELVTVQARLNQTATAKSDPELFLIAEEVERLTSELRDNTMSIRMLPIGTTFSKFTRLVRDLSEELGKEIDLTTEGAETELDKTVIEKLNEPMVHLIRNSIDHGVELPDVREGLGKSRKGNVNLSASHSGANVLIRIKDDGKGLDPDAIRRKAIERGMIASDTEMSLEKLFNLVMEPGFSTIEEVTSISGRGVGMDVVRKSIESLRGSIEISSQKNVGTEITMKLPLTLAIIDGLLIKIEKQYFVFPLSIVEECIELTPEDMDNTHGEHFVNVRDEIVPFIRLREHFYIDGETPDIEQIVITEWQNRKIGFVVDNVIGDHQTVIKSLGRVYRDVEGMAGATILGDGTVALILDIPRLIHLVQESETVLHQQNIF